MALVQGDRVVCSSPGWWEGITGEYLGLISSTEGYVKRGDLAAFRVSVFGRRMVCAAPVETFAAAPATNPDGPVKAVEAQSPVQSAAPPCSIQDAINVLEIAARPLNGKQYWTAQGALDRLRCISLDPEAVNALYTRGKANAGTYDWQYASGFNGTATLAAAFEGSHA